MRSSVHPLAVQPPLCAFGLPTVPVLTTLGMREAAGGRQCAAAKPPLLVCIYWSVGIELPVSLVRDVQYIVYAGTGVEVIEIYQVYTWHGSVTRVLCDVDGTPCVHEQLPRGARKRATPLYHTSTL